MRRDLFPHVRSAREQMRIHVSEQEHQLEKQNAGRPNGGGSAKVRKKHFANHGLAHEEEKRA
jgi:hypothetical protein